MTPGQNIIRVKILSDNGSNEGSQHVFVEKRINYLKNDPQYLSVAVQVTVSILQ